MRLDPIIVSIGPISIYWYSFAYVIGILFTYWYLHKLDYQKIFTQNFYDSLLTAVIVGIILGGRLGYLLIYNTSIYISNPIDVFKIWEGGMSFHGGLIGTIFTVIMICKIYKMPILYTLDLIACGAPLGIFLGRIGNFINGELFGTITNVQWGMIFPQSEDDLVRHPVQLYEAFFEGLLLLIFINLTFFYTKVRYYRGKLTSISMIWYGIARYLVEFFREPDYNIGYLWFNLTMGQLLSIPMIIIGLILYLKASGLILNIKHVK